MSDYLNLNQQSLDFYMATILLWEALCKYDPLSDHHYFHLTVLINSYSNSYLIFQNHFSKWSARHVRTIGDARYLAWWWRGRTGHTGRPPKVKAERKVKHAIGIMIQQSYIKYNHNTGNIYDRDLLWNRWCRRHIGTVRDRWCYTKRWGDVVCSIGILSVLYSWVDLISIWVCRASTWPITRRRVIPGGCGTTGGTAGWCSGRRWTTIKKI